MLNHPLAGMLGFENPKPEGAVAPFQEGVKPELVAALMDNHRKVLVAIARGDEIVLAVVKRWPLTPRREQIIRVIEDRRQCLIKAGVIEDVRA